MQSTLTAESSLHEVSAMRPHFFALLLASAAIAACASPGDPVHCSVTRPGVSGCLEFTGLTVEQNALFESRCRGIADAHAASDASTTIHATWVRSGCSRVGAIGGCRQPSDNFAITNWYYARGDAGASPDWYRSACSRVRGVWITP